MNLYSIYAYDAESGDDPIRTYIVTAENDEQALDILKASQHGDQHVRFVVTKGKLETTAPGPQLWGWVGSARMLKAG